MLALAAGFHDQRPVLIGTTVVGLALAVGGTLADLPTAAGLGKMLAAGALGMLFIPLLERAWHVAVVALLVIAVDTYSVFAGPTKQLLESGDDVVSTFTVPFTAPGVYGAAGIGITDFLFLGLFCGAALHWRLRPRLTIPLCALSFSASIAVAQLLDRSVPALPLLSLAFVLPNIGRFRPGAPDRPWELRTQPATTANSRRNAAARPDRRSLWTSAQDACWELLDPLIAPGAAVGIVGAGNCDDLPLTRIAERAGRVDLLDLDPAACRGAIAHEPRAVRPKLQALEVDASGGHADRISAADRGRPRHAAAGGRLEPVRRRRLRRRDRRPFYSQLLYPGLRDAGVPDERIMLALANYGPALTGLGRLAHARQRARRRRRAHPRPGRLVGRARAAVHARSRAGGRRPLGRRRAGAAADRVGPGGDEPALRPRGARGHRSCARRSGAGRSGTAPTTWRARPSPRVPPGLRPRR